MICPNCQNDQTVTEQHYGALYTCKSCQAVYFINFEGQPLFDDQVESVEQTFQPETETAPSIAEPVQTFQQPDFQSEPAQDSSLDESQPLVSFEQNNFSNETPSYETLAPTQDSFSDVAKDISDYGNTETQIAHLNYDLKISGLDTTEIVSHLKEALEDSRFGWDAGEMMRNMKHGEIRFEKLNPVKAYILAKRLQFLDVEKVWKQNAVG